MNNQFYESSTVNKDSLIVEGVAAAQTSPMLCPTTTGDTPIITAEDLGVRPLTIARRTCAKCPNKLGVLNVEVLCHACQVVERRRNLNGPVVVQKRRRPHADTI